jgi:hypothetical protein
MIHIMIVSQRLVKKTMYAVLGVVVFGAGVLVLQWGVQSSISRQPQPTPEPVVEFLPVEVGNVTIIPHAVQPAEGTRSVDIVASVRNPNLRAGVPQYPLAFVLYDTNGQIIHSVEDPMYLLPGMQQYAVVLGIQFSADRRLGRVEVVQPADVQFIRLPESIGLPSFSLFLRDRVTRQVGNTATETQTGIVTNTGTFDWHRVEVTGVGFDEEDTIVAAGKTFVGTLLVGEQREFSLQWPAPSRSVSRVVVQSTTNIFREDNIVDIIGDPAGLR